MFVEPTCEPNRFLLNSLMPFGYPDTFQAKPIARSKWGNTTPIPPSWHQDEEKKRLFGVELAKNNNGFEAALVVFNDNANDALWASAYWIGDPLVLATKDLYLKNIAVQSKLLDKETFAARLLTMAEEKHPVSQLYYMDAKDRLKAMELYGDTQGFFAKDQPQLQINNNIVNDNSLTVKYIRPEEKEKTNNYEETIDEAETIEIDESLPPLDLKVKLIANS